MKVRKDTIVTVPLKELLDWVNKKYSIHGELSSIYIRNNELTVIFSSDKSSSSKNTKRNRMRTRGWKIVGKVKVGGGQIARVYEPFVKALSDKGLTDVEQRSIVKKILEDNGNIPNDSNVEYFLDTSLDLINGRNIVD